MSTYSPKQRELENKDWFLVDATEAVLGRLASEVAHILKGKNKPTYSPSMDAGDHVVIINAEKIKVTGRKAEQKVYHRHSGYPGGLKTDSYEDVMNKNPEEIIRAAIRGMLPKNSLGRQMITKLRIYAGADHPHEGQTPQALKLECQLAAEKVAAKAAVKAAEEKAAREAA